MRRIATTNKQQNLHTEIQYIHGPQEARTSNTQNNRTKRISAAHKGNNRPLFIIYHVGYDLFQSPSSFCMFRQQQRQRPHIRSSSSSLLFFCVFVHRWAAAVAVVGVVWLCCTAMDPWIPTCEDSESNPSQANITSCGNSVLKNSWSYNSAIPFSPSFSLFSRNETKRGHLRILFCERKNRSYSEHVVIVVMTNFEDKAFLILKSSGNGHF